jgi:hypothetical protein
MPASVQSCIGSSSVICHTLLLLLVTLLLTHHFRGIPLTTPSLS